MSIRVLLAFLAQAAAVIKSAHTALAPSLQFVQSPAENFSGGLSNVWEGPPIVEALPPAEETNLLDRYLAKIATPQNSSCEPGHTDPFCLNNLVTDQQIVSGWVPIQRIRD
jgi:hypothetical protein